jgi:hypothetical protein
LYRKLVDEYFVEEPATDEAPPPFETDSSDDDDPMLEPFIVVKFV